MATVTFNDMTVNNILTHKMPFSLADMNLINSEPNLLAALAMGEVTPISSVTLDADDSWYACSERYGTFMSPYVVDQRAGYGVEKVDVVLDTVYFTARGTNTVSNDGEWVDVTYVDNNLGAFVRLTDATTLNGDVEIGKVYKLDIEVQNGFIYQFSGSTDDTGYTWRSPNGLNSFLVEFVNTNPYINIRIDAVAGFTTKVKIASWSLREATAQEITDYNSNIRLTNQQKGLQTTALLLDGAGVPESYNSTPNTARVYSDTIISTGFKPSIARYSIEEESSGFMQDFGSDSKQSATSIPSGVAES